MTFVCTGSLCNQHPLKADAQPACSTEEAKEYKDHLRICIHLPEQFRSMIVITEVD